MLELFFFWDKWHIVYQTWQQQDFGKLQTITAPGHSLPTSSCITSVLLPQKPHIERVKVVSALNCVYYKNCFSTFKHVHNLALVLLKASPFPLS